MSNADTATPEKKPWYKRVPWWGWVAAAVVLLVMGGISNLTNPEPEGAAPAPTTSATEPAVAELSGTPAPEPTHAEPEPESTEPSVDRGALLYADIQQALDAAGDDRFDLRMIAVTDVTDEKSYLRVHYQNPILDEEDAEDLVREIYGFTASDAFIDGERNTIVVQSSDGRDWNVWVRREGQIAQFSTSMWG